MIYYKKINDSNTYDNINKEDIKKCIDPEIFKQIYITREQLDDIEEFDLDNYLYGLTKGMEEK